MESILRALSMAFSMGWEILWPLILGFALSAVVQAVVSHREMARLLPDDRPKSIATALALGAASSSCSYAAVALARSLFRKGANFAAAMAFEMASTNLVFTKASVGPRTCPKQACSDGNNEKLTFARFSERLNFRLFQQYRPNPDIPRVRP
jgi:Predicted permease